MRKQSRYREPRASFARLLILTVSALGVTSAAAQFPDVLSEEECPGCAAQYPYWPFEGVWSSSLTSADDAGWGVDDLFCFAACTREARAFASRAAADPSYAKHSALDLYALVAAANVRAVASRVIASMRSSDPSKPVTIGAPAFECDRQGFAVQVVSGLPLEISAQPDRVVLRYEELGAERTVLLDVATAASDGGVSSLGVSRGRIENGLFIVETRGIPAGRLYAGLGGFLHSGHLRAVERYSVSRDGRWLSLELTLDDSVTFIEPLVVTKRWQRIPGERIRPHTCDAMSGGLEGVLAEYVDPRAIDARRKRALP